MYPLARQTQKDVAIERLIDAASIGRLRRDAISSHAGAEESRVLEPDGETWRGGSPDRWLESAVGGVVLQALYYSPAMLARLEQLTGMRWIPSGAAGTYSYYCRPGHYLGVHRDVDACDLAMITCLYDSTTRPSTQAGTLCLYPHRTAETIPELRARPHKGAVYVRLKPGESILLFGGEVPHRVVPIGPGQTRIVAPLCYRPE